MKEAKGTSTFALCRAGVVAALYVVLTATFGGMASGPLQIRPAEALCILPIFFPETIIGLFAGCALSNLIAGLGVWDVLFGSLTTLVAAFLTWFCGKVFKRGFVSAMLGAIPPVVLNAAVIPFVIILAGGEESLAMYWLYFWQLFLTQTVWVYALGIPLYFSIKRMREKGVRVML